MNIEEGGTRCAWMGLTARYLWDQGIIPMLNLQTVKISKTVHVQNSVITAAYNLAGTGGCLISLLSTNKYGSSHAAARHLLEGLEKVETRVLTHPAISNPRRARRHLGLPPGGASAKLMWVLVACPPILRGHPIYEEWPVTGGKIKTGGRHRAALVIPQKTFYLIATFIINRAFVLRQRPELAEV